MSVNIPRTFVFTDGRKLTNNEIESELSNIVNIINNANAGLLQWDNVNAKTVTFSGTVAYSSLTPNTAIACNAAKALVSSTTTDTELGYVHGVTSAIQTQINGKAATTTTISAGTGLTGGGDLSANRTITLSTPVAVTNGGTGISTVTQGDLLYGSASNTISSLAKNTSSTRYLSNTGITNNPAWAQVDLSNGVTGNLPVTNLNSGTSASSSTFWRGDGTWAAPSGSGTVNSGTAPLLAFYASSTNAVSNVNADASMGTNKITNLKAGTASTDAINLGQLHFLQFVSATNATSTSTTSTTMTNTNLAATITPTSSSSSILILVCGNVQTTTGSTDTSAVTIKRGTTVLGSSSNGLVYYQPRLASTARFPCNILYVDAPATTSATTYTVAINTNNGGTFTWNDLTNTCSIFLVEVQ